MRARASEGADPRHPPWACARAIRCIYCVGSVESDAKRADKPGSVTDDHLSCLHVAAQLLARYPSAGRAGPWRSYSRLLRKGLAKPPCHHDAGGLLHHRFSFSLTRRRRAAGVFFSAALSVGSPRLAVSQLPALWSPDFPHAHRVRNGSRDRLARFAMRYCTMWPEVLRAGVCTARAQRRPGAGAISGRYLVMHGVPRWSGSGCGGSYG